ncbi:hypothetical protein HPB48_011970 [Haemaphysalis longicornis]|uniref:Uncharacterized protein n=1 Tax=Haemaphysalis longicornis TaxID=44386 RepID=A0A9J6H4V0_HAELO|nr:hypothetical protein HPB48_011970 [Haemaphysalis longicornis]
MKAVRPWSTFDIDLSAYANARKYYDQKRHAAGKQQKTIESSAKAYKSAEKKTREALKQARKAFWFEKFFWFISSEDYLVVGGRDAQQNEAIVKKHLRPGDILPASSSRTPLARPVPPKTLNEAGTMAICYSAAWDAKVVTSAWWVHHHQVSKTAPTGQYLTPGAFMIRGKKNYLPPSYLIMGFAFLYKLDDESLERHRGERRVRVAEDDTEASTDPQEEGPELELSDESDSGEGQRQGCHTSWKLFQSEHDTEETVGEVVYSQPTKGPQMNRRPAPKPKAQPPPPQEDTNESTEETLKQKQVGDAADGEEQPARNKAAMQPTEDDDAQADAEEDEDEANVGDEQQRLLASLTGCPVAEDGLLFAVPICAPYGTGRRGKAAKTALGVFLHDKNTTPRERDLLRATKDQDISRNIPGKVKLSAPHLQKRK